MRNKSIMRNNNIILMNKMKYEYIISIDNDNMKHNKMMKGMMNSILNNMVII